MAELGLAIYLWAKIIAGGLVGLWLAFMVGLIVRSHRKPRSRP